MERSKSFLGTGWSFPPTFTKDEKGVELTSDVEDINNSLAVLLSTSLGERVMRPTYGCDLKILLFESLDSSLIAFVKDLVETAITRYEARIDAEQIEINTDEIIEGKLLIAVTYRVRATNSRFNYVYPFYIKEGTNIE